MQASNLRQFAILFLSFVLFLLDGWQFNMTPQNPVRAENRPLQRMSEVPSSRVIDVRMHAPTRIALPASLFVVVTWTATNDAKQLSRQDRAQIKTLCERYRSAWIANDQKAVLATLTEDAVLLPHHGHTPVTGTAAIKKFWWPAEGPPTTVTEFTMTTDEINGSADVGYVWGKFSLAFNYEEQGQKKSSSNAGSGSWLITHRMWDDPVAQVQN